MVMASKKFVEIWIHTIVEDRIIYMEEYYLFLARKRLLISFRYAAILQQGGNKMSRHRRHCCRPCCPGTIIPIRSGGFGGNGIIWVIFLLLIFASRSNRGNVNTNIINLDDDRYDDYDDVLV
jgi:hypothetical protein